MDFPPAELVAKNALLVKYLLLLHQLLHQRVKILQPCILDNHPPTPMLVLNPHLHSPLQPVLSLTHIKEVKQLVVYLRSQAK
jgi:hypothetical protein